MRTSNDPAVTVSGLVKTFGDFTAVNNISFEVNRGEIFGFLGPNGAGKSTTIKMLCGLLMPTAGKGQVGGFDIISQAREIKQNIGYMSQKFSLYDDLTVEENVNFYSGIYKVPNREARKDEIIEKTGLKDLRKALTGTLPGGWKQKLALGCALLHKPKILFLDEPTSGVDPITRNIFWNVIKDLAGRGITVFITTHYMDEAENCGRMILIYKGNIIALGTPHEMKTKFMKNDVLEIAVPDSENWIDKLMEVDTVKETALFGSGLHAVTPDAKRAVPEIEGMFKNAGIKDFKVERIEPSLEDVFVSLIENYDQTHKDDKSPKG